MSDHHDVIVVGLGGTGSAAAHRIAERGASVLGLEQHTPSREPGSGHGGSHIIRQAYSEEPAYLPLLLRSHELWRRLERESGLELMRLTGGLTLGCPDSRAVEQTLGAAHYWGIDHEVLDAADVRRRFPALEPRHREIAVYEPSAGVVRTEATVAAQLRQARRSGAKLRFGEHVTGWDTITGNGGVRVSTRAGNYVADRLVVCPGARAPQLLPDLGVRFGVECRAQYRFRSRGSPGRSRHDIHPAYVRETPGGVRIHGFPPHDGSGEARMELFRRGARRIPADTERRACEAGVSGVHDRVLTRLHTITPDEHFVVSQHPGHPRVTVACGFGHGFEFVPVMGEVLADLALDGATIHPIEPFDPARFTVGAV